MKEAVARFYETADPETAADLLRDITMTVPSARPLSRCDAWLARCATGSNPSWPDTKPGCRMVPPKG
jgi:hypothetical protein